MEVESAALSESVWLDAEEADTPSDVEESPGVLLLPDVPAVESPLADGPHPIETKRPMMVQERVMAADD
jgi:hypothetical protein